ncbi:hypothetical protein BVC80_1543g187 [Macleaya cordata]|uniref:Transmembrane protein n=1 Tax=Macleaya cordata TaxID=56857 RepID=A0A200R1Z0_MACCD|nr:hypothetical protein BVC80_1543g187 [Macleaya cordata]
MGRRWMSSGFRLPGFEFSLAPSIFRWPAFNFSYFSSWWTVTEQLRWPDFDFSIVDNVMWSFITAIESLVLVSMLCLFFVFCGCTF